MVFVTGGSGFIGRYVVKRLLAENEKVVVLVRDAKKYSPQGSELVIDGDLSAPEKWRESLAKYQPDACIHLAWEGIPDYSYEMSARNLMYGMNVLDVCKRAEIKRLVITGSCWEYDSPQGSVSANAPVTFDKPFQAAKCALRVMAHSFCRERGISFSWLRLFYVYGPGQREGSLIPYIIKSLREGKSPELNGAHNRNDFVYVDDAAEAITKAALFENTPEVINVGSGRAEDVLSVMKMTAAIMGRGIKTGDYPDNGRSVDFFADADEMKKAFSWRAKTTLEEGIGRMIHAMGAGEAIDG